jgi:hypothetical protein
MNERITSKDLKRALSAHVDCLARVGITYDGRLGLDEGSKTYGCAYRLYRTGYVVEQHDGTHRATTGHGRPPVGDDYLGMTAREAYETLTARTRDIYDTVYALRECGVLDIGKQLDGTDH